MPAITSVSFSGNPYVDGLLTGVRWAPNSLTFSFPVLGSYYGSPYGYGETTNNFGALYSTQIVAARAVLTTYASVANLTFTEIGETASQHADIRFARSDEVSTAWAYFPHPAAEGGDVWFNNSSGYYNNPARGNYAYTTFLHEVGHALGLDHSHEGNVMPVARDSMEYTVMSYRAYVGASTTTGYTNEHWGFAQSLMMYDIAAIQHLYGANYATQSGNTTYSWSPTTGEMFINGVGQGAPGGNRIFMTVWDGGGSDTYDFSNYATALNISLLPGEWTTTSSTQLARLHWDGSRVATGNIANALLFNDDGRALVENARGGSGNDTIVGNRTSNVLWGNGGNDRLDGREGQDSAGFSGAMADYRWWQNSDRSYTVTDLRAGSPDGTDTLFSIDSFVFRDTVYQLPDLSRTITLRDTTNSYQWNEAISVYDSTGALDSATIRNDDGRSYLTDYDQNSVFAWREAISAYDAQNRLDHVSIRNDDNTIFFTYYDASRTQTWSEAISGYDAQSRLDYVTINHDNGTSSYTNYDQGNTSNVSYAVYHFDAHNQLTRSFIAFDDGTTQIV
jgi:serralysin